MRLKIATFALVVFGMASSLMAQDASLRARDWTTLASVNVRPAQVTDGVGLDIPTFPDNIGYAWTSFRGPISGTVRIALRVEMTGSPSFRWDTEPNNNCYGTPATVRPIFIRWPGRGNKNIAFSNRWYSNPVAFMLGGSTWSADIPLDPAGWSNVNGKFGTAVPAEWQADLDGVQAIGVSMGGGCFFGHGVGVQNGTARVVITALGVQ